MTQNSWNWWPCELFLACWTVFAATACLTYSSHLNAVENSPLSWRKQVVKDWQLQEKYLNRTFESPEALTDLAKRSATLLERLEEENFITQPNRDTLHKTLAGLTVERIAKMKPGEVRENYLALRWTLRDIIFDNPLVKDTPIVFMKGDRYIWQLIHEYLSFYYRYTNTTGDGFFLLKTPGKSFETTPLAKGKLPRGVYSTPSLSYDAKTLYFAYADFSKIVPEGTPRTTEKELIPDFRNFIDEYLKEKEGKFHLFKMDIATGNVEQLTTGPNDDFDPVLLPDGDLVFVSTRRGGFARCVGLYEPVQTATLHKLHKNGKVQCLSWHETGEWNPAVLADGRIVYSRWDYVDREAARYMNLWVTNPDGTGAQALFGNYTEKIVAALQAEEIPGSNKIMFLGSGHHLAVGGPLAILDPTKVRYDTKTGQDMLDCIDVISPEIAFPETLVPGNPKLAYVSDRYYYGPYPLSEDFYLTSFSHDWNGGYLAQDGYGYRGSGGTSYTAGKLGLYYRDRFGNLELIYEDPKTSCRYPLQVKTRPVPRQIASKLPEKKTEFGTMVLSNVNESLMPMPKERPIKEIRVFQIFPKAPGFMRDDPKVSHAFAANSRMYLGSVPVESDGSAHFQVPACKPLYFQAVDAAGKAVRTMVSEVYLQPGETRGCIGCHEQAQTTQKNLTARSLALAHAPSQLAPGPKGTRPFSYPILVQSILDRSCVQCHDGNKESAKPKLTGQPQDRFTVSYNALEPYVRYYGWGTTIHRITSEPGKSGCDMSKLTNILDDKNHKGKMNLSEVDRRALYLWLDANIPFYGTEIPEDMKRQLCGEEVTEPHLQ